MSIMTEVRKWLPLTLITVATLLALLFTARWVDQPPPMHDPMKEFAQ